MNASGLIYLTANLVLSLVGTLALKWRATAHSGVATDKGRITYLISMFLDPWVILSLGAAVLAMVAWMSALERVELSRAFAFTALIYVLVPLSSWLLFHERITLLQALGIGMIVGGIVIAELGRV